MDTAPSPSHGTPETAAELQQRIAWEAEGIAKARASVAAGRLIDSEEIDAWIDRLGTVHEVPPPRSEAVSERYRHGGWVVTVGCDSNGLSRPSCDAMQACGSLSTIVMVDTDGRALELQVGPASVQDGDGAVPLLKASRRRFPIVELAFADAAYAAESVRDATSIAIEIVRKVPGQVGFEVHPPRWVVERCFTWLGRNRHLAKNLRGHYHLRDHLSLCRICHAAHQTDGSFHMSSESDSEMFLWMVDGETDQRSPACQPR